MGIIRWLDDNFEKAFCNILLAVMTLATTLQVVCRIGGIPLSWSEEVARYVFVWIIYISCSYAIKEDKHVRIDAVMLLFNERGRFALRVISNILFLIFAVVIAYHGSILLYNIVYVRKQISPALGMPMGIPYASYIVGCTLMTFRLIQNTILLFKKRSNGKPVG